MIVETRFKLEKGNPTFKIECLKCGIMIRINPNKHRNRDKRYCPRCRTAYKFDIGWMGPNLRWIREKINQVRKKDMKPLIHSRRYATDETWNKIDALGFYKRSLK